YAYTVGPQLYRPATAAAGVKSSIRRPSELYSRSSWFVGTMPHPTGAGAFRRACAGRETRGRAGSRWRSRLAGRGPGGWPSSDQGQQVKEAEAGPHMLIWDRGPRGIAKRRDDSRCVIAVQIAPRTPRLTPT